MIKFGQKAAPHVDAAKKAGIRRVADWVEEALPEEEQDETHVMVNQIECAEEGCPPVECVIALLRKPKLLFKVRATTEPARPHPPRTALHRYRCALTVTDFQTSGRRDPGGGRGGAQQGARRREGREAG